MADDRLRSPMLQRPHAQPDRKTLVYLWVIRHAKSSWAEPKQRDFDRPLNGRGEKDGKRMVGWLRTQATRPTWIVSSDAARARATTQFVREGCEVAADCVLFEHRLYEASPDTILQVV